MRMKILASILLLVASVIPSLGQSGTVSDSVAERMVFENIGQQADPTVMVSGIGFNTADTQVIASNVTSYCAQYQSMIDSLTSTSDMNAFAAQRDSLTANTYATITAQLSSGSAVSALYNYIQAEKSNMQADPTFGNSAYHTVATVSPDYFDGNPTPPVDEGGDDFLLMDIMGQTSCVTSASDNGSFAGGNIWQNFTFGLGPQNVVVSSIASGVDGSLVALDTTGQIWAASSRTSQWIHMNNSGVVKHIAMGDFQSLFGIGTDNHVYRYDTVHNSWNPLSQSITVTKISASTDVNNFGMFAANGANLYLWNASNNTWSFVQTFPSAIQSITTQSAQSLALYDSHFVFVMTTDGKIYYTSGVNKNFVYEETVTGEGTPVEIKINNDGSVFTLNSAGVLYKGWYNGTQVATGVSAMATDSLYDVYSLSGSSIQRFLATSTFHLAAATTSSILKATLANTISNLDGTNRLLNSETKVYLQCPGQQRQLLMDYVYSAYMVGATTRVKALSLTNTWEDANGVPWGSWLVSWYCTADTQPPDFDPVNGVRDPLYPSPWGWDTYALCFSLTGHQPYTCGTGWPMSAEKFVSNPGLGSCTRHP